MSRLTFRIWLTFWAVLAVTFLAALGVDYALALQRARDLDRVSPTALADEGAQALARGGEPGWRYWWLKEHNALPELMIYVVAPDGRELSGRPVGEVARALAGPRGGSPFPAEVDRVVRGRTYHFVIWRAHRLAFDLWDILLQPWVLAGLVLTVSGLGAAALAASITRPIRRLQAWARAIAAEDLRGAMGESLTTRRDEVGALARDVDDMARRLQALIDAREAMLRDVSHELRGPLARLRAISDLARRRGAADPSFERMDREIDRLDAMIGQLLQFSRLQAQAVVPRRSFDLADLLATAVEDAGLEAAGAGKRVVLSACGPTRIDGDSELIRSALENILRNAVRFSPAGGLVEASLTVDAASGLVEVRDRGPGVAEAELSRIFEPFHGEGSGAGLGLAITRRVAGLHRGAVTAESREGGGLVVTLRLPLSAAAETLQTFAAAGHT